MVDERFGMDLRREMAVVDVEDLNLVAHGACFLGKVITLLPTCDGRRLSRRRFPQRQVDRQ
jgi:hypothetical protein